MRRCPAIISALPRELMALVKSWKRSETAPNVWVWTNGCSVAACAGMGEARGRLAVEAAMAAMPVTDLISVGLAGACDPRLKVGDIVRAGVVIERASGDRFDDSQGRHGIGSQGEPKNKSQSGLILVSCDAIASVAEKARLRMELGAAAVDMEGATVARRARKFGLGFSVVKAISDEADFEVADLARFATVDGQFRERAFAFHAALRPWRWGKMIALGRNGKVSLAALTRTLLADLDWYKTQD